MPLTHIYHEKLKNGEIQPDEAQAHAITALQHVQEKLSQNPCVLEETNGICRWVAGNPDEARPKGVYFFGTVGRGKSMVMDLFFETAPVEKKRRVHFHSFMEELHDRMHDMGFVDGLDPVFKMASDIASEAELLCFDEFYITNIADAMMLGRFFQMLFACGVVTCATSNWAPENLFHEGHNRKRFLPFITMLEEHMQVIDLGSGRDYRRSEDDTLPYVFTDGSTEEMEKLFTAEAGKKINEGTNIEAGRVELTTIKESKGKAVWFDFDTLCGQPWGREQYMDIIQAYDTFFLSGIPVLSAQSSDAAMRFVVLIDIAYENDVKCILSTADELEELCTEGDSAFAFERTVSRIYEMQKW